MSYFFVTNGQLHTTTDPPARAKLFKPNLKLLLPPLITELHQSLQAWTTIDLSPGPIIPRRIYFNDQGTLAFHFLHHSRPKPLMRVGLAPILASWLVLLDKWMETYVVLARARTVWSLEELSGALAFLSPAFLPDKLIAHPPNNWERIAQALAHVIADGQLSGQPTNQHWQ